MSVTIINKFRDSMLRDKRIKVGTQIHSVDGEPIHDIIDLMYHCEKIEFDMLITDTDGKYHSIHIQNETDRPLARMLVFISH